MNKQEVRTFIITTVKELVNQSRDAKYIRGQAVGMVKAFKAMGVITDDERLDILDEILDMI